MDIVMPLESLWWQDVQNCFYVDSHFLYMRWHSAKKKRYFFGIYEMWDYLNFRVFTNPFWISLIGYQGTPTCRIYAEGAVPYKNRTSVVILISGHRLRYLGGEVGYFTKPISPLNYLKRRLIPTVIMLLEEPIFTGHFVYLLQK